MSERTPTVGDIILKKDRFTKDCHIGIIYEIKDNKHGFRSVFIHWGSDDPKDYDEEHGYSSTNVHNLRSEFTIISKGEIIDG